jgi:transcriptional regulator with GAF, ATPase, and Fis domain
MAAQTSWLGDAPAVDRSVSIEREDAALAKIGIDIDELYGSGLPRIVGNSAALQHVLGLVGAVAQTEATVLINGETGTGKELVARAIYWRSRCSAPSFVGVNCAAIPRALIALELFGHEKGSFTGATQRRLGRFELNSEIVRSISVNGQRERRRKRRRACRS